MKKDAFYFPHFCNARHDRKIKRVTKELGVEGYGIYFMLLEVLREQTDFKFPMGDIDLLSDEFGTSEQKVRTVICNYQLFEVDEDQKFFSTKLVYYLAPYIEKSERARLAANKRWSNTNTLMLSDANAYANALQMECSSNADAMQVKDSKLEETKGEEKIISRFAPPTENEVSLYCLERNSNVSASKFIDFYESKGWMVGKNKMKDWKASIRTWEAKEPKKALEENKDGRIVGSKPTRREDFY